MPARSLQVIAGLVAGLFAAEAAIRLCTHPSLDYASIFRPGPYCQDPELGLTSACPGWSGFMLTAGMHRYVPVKLNSLGYRGPFQSPGPEGGRRKVVVIVGGQSQGFGFGLLDRETYPFAAAKYGSCGSYEVHNISFVGLANTVSWHFFERDVLRRYRPDHVILAVYTREARPDPATDLRDYSANARGNGYAYGWRFEVPRWLPDLGRSSHAVIRLAGAVSEGRHALNRWLGVPPPAAPTVPALSRDIVRDYSDRTRRLNAAFSLLILPWGAPTQDERFKAELKDFRVVDTHEGVLAAGLQSDFLADGHYGSKQADLIGRMLASEICAVDFPK